jgi:hypothetical protein
MPAPVCSTQFVDLTLSEDSGEEEVVHSFPINTTTTTSAILSPFTPATTKLTVVSTVLNVVSNRNGVSDSFEGSFGSKEATTYKGRQMLRREYKVHKTLKKSYCGAADLKDLPVVLALAWSNTGILQGGSYGGFMMRHVDFYLSSYSRFLLTNFPLLSHFSRCALAVLPRCFIFLSFYLLPTHFIQGI